MAVNWLESWESDCYPPKEKRLRFNLKKTRKGERKVKTGPGAAVSPSGTAALEAKYRGP